MNEEPEKTTEKTSNFAFGPVSIRNDNLFQRDQDHYQRWIEDLRPESFGRSNFAGFN